MKIHIDGSTYKNDTKANNQDSFLYKTAKVGKENIGLIVVADGVGGLKNGEIASSIAVKKIDTWFKNEFVKEFGDIERIMLSLIEKVNLINDEILIYGKKNDVSLATTITIVLFYYSHYYLFHVGDSRVYKFNTMVNQLTQDHKIMDTEKNKYLLTEYLGGHKKDFNFEIRSGEVKHNDIFLVGSDGAFNKVNNHMIKEILLKNRKNDLKNQVVKFIQYVKELGERDNITLIIASIKRG
ncbi:MAG: PP2C family protein-serine/threonine phosphatase [Eubacteriaceae bacterium]